MELARKTKAVDVVVGAVIEVGTDCLVFVIEISAFLFLTSGLLSLLPFLVKISLLGSFVLSAQVSMGMNFFLLSQLLLKSLL